MTEKALQTKVLKKLRGKYGGESVWVNASPGPYDKRGISDILGVMRGLPVAIELKRPETYKDPYFGCSPAQGAFLAGWSKAGGIAMVADSWESVERVLDRALKGELPSGVISYEKTGALGSRRAA